MTVQKTINFLSIIFLFTCTITSCYYDVEEVLYANTDCTTTNMSYSADIVPIMATKCLVCHSASAKLGNIVVDGYGEISKYIANGQLLGSIKHSNGYSPMPQGGAKLASCDIAKIEAWINDGAPNN